METLTVFMPENTIVHLGWTLFHFLWQGLVIAAAAYGILRLSRRATSAMRYGVACLGLGLMAAAPIVTFVTRSSLSKTAGYGTRSYNAASEEIRPQGEKNLIDTMPAASVALPVQQPPRTFHDRIEELLPCCVAGWAVGVTALSLWYLGGWQRLQKMRHMGTRDVTADIRNTMSALCQRFGIRRSIQIVESSRVETPSVIGWLKPIILMPVSALTGLDAAQLNAMIAHELAHIKRCDYPVNIIQTVIEIFGFYHPAVWWLSRQIRIERENCCDDMAVAVLQGRKAYAEALLSMEAVRSRRAALSAAGGRLEDRIKRLFSSPESYRRTGWLPTVMLFVAAVVCMSGIEVHTPVFARPAERILQFPADYSLGDLYIQEDRDHRDSVVFNPFNDLGDWKQFGAAQGLVRIPANTRVKLIVAPSAWEQPEKLSPLRRLEPDALYALNLDQGWSSGTFVTDNCVPYLAHLTGLRQLEIHGTNITDRGLRQLSGMEHLQRLMAPGNLTNGGLGAIVQLKSLTGVRIYNNRLTDRGIRLLAQLPHLKELNLFGPRLTDEALSYLPEQKELEYLSLGPGAEPFSVKGFAAIARIPKLKTLWIDTKQCTDEQLEQLAGHPTLERLSVHWESNFTDQGVYHIARIPNLKKLDLGLNQQLTNRSIEYLTRSKNLDWLWLPGVPFTDEGVMRLSALPQLEYLFVGGASTSPLTDSSLAEIAKLSKLKTLWTGGTGITDRGIRELAKLSALEELAIATTSPSVTNDGLAHLASLEHLEKLNWKATSNITFEGLNRLNGMKNIKRLDVMDIERGTHVLDLSGLKSLEDLRIQMPLKFDRQPHRPSYTDAFHDEDLACLAGLKELNWITLCGNGLTDAGLSHLSGLNKMGTLFLYGQSEITDEGLKALSGMNRLWQLHIKSGQFTDKALDRLAGLEELRMLELESETGFGRQAANAIKNRMPNLLIVQLDAVGQPRGEGAVFGGGMVRQSR